MTSVLFEPDSGRLRLGRTAFDALVDAATGRQDREPSDLAEVAALRAAGVLDEQGALHPTVGAAIGAIAAPVCRLILRTQDAQGRQDAHEGWIAGHAAALLACPTTPTVVWRVLINLLPRDGELARRHART